MIDNDEYTKKHFEIKKNVDMKKELKTIVHVGENILYPEIGRVLQKYMYENKEALTLFVTTGILSTAVINVLNGQIQMLPESVRKEAAARCLEDFSRAFKFYIDNNDFSGERPDPSEYNPKKEDL